MELKSDLELKNRLHEVDMPQNEEPSNSDTNTSTIGLTESVACFKLPQKRNWYGKKKDPKDLPFWYEINFIDEKTIGKNNEILSGKHFYGDPITCILPNAERGSKGEFRVNGCQNHFTLYFEASRLKDCPQRLDRERLFYLPFRITIKDLIDGKPQEKGSVSFEDYFEIKVKKYEPTLSFTFYPSKQKLVYTTDPNKRYQLAGKLKVSHSAKFSCSPALNKASFKMLSRLEVIDDDGNKKELVHNDRIYLKLKDKNNEDSFAISRDGLSFLPGTVESYDVVVDMNTVNNPHSKDIPDKYEVLIDYNRVTQSAGSFEILRNPMLTRGVASFLMPSSLRPYNLDFIGNKELELRLSQNANIEYTMKLCFANTADAIDPNYPNASVLVWGVIIEDVEEKEGNIHTRGNQALKEIFALQDVQDEKGPWVLNQHWGSKREFPIRINSDQIESITPLPDKSRTYAIVCIRMTYYMLEDDKGVYYSRIKGGERFNDKKHSVTIRLRIFKEPHPEWLCVDFGTSAVVAACSQRISGDDNGYLINLKDIKKQLLTTAYEKDSPKLSVNDEDGVLISSSACFNDVNSEVYDDIKPDGSNYTGLPLWFSPSVADIKKDFLLPCLKSIIGYKQLPNILLEQSLDKFTYKIDSKNGEIKLIDDNGFPTKLMRVEEVTKVIYRQLFTYYLSQKYDKRRNELTSRNINKLILSVPNTFTPLNIASVKRLARETMPNIYPEHLRTVSESDAVACYYVAHHEDFLNKSDIGNRANELRKEERVLVFDMGAGTLDLTWFERTEDSDGKVTVTIKGKVGVNKAGNYLDYELGIILKELYKDNDNTQDNEQQAPQKLSEIIEKALTTNLSEFINKKGNSKSQMDLKNHVKEVKKLLSEEDAKLPMLELDGEKASKQLTARNVTSHTHFSEIITEMTTDVLRNFVYRYSKNEDKKIDIDVVIFSGRSTSLKAIRESVKNNIGQFCTHPDKLLFADICMKKLQQNVEQKSDDAGSTALKTIVTEGALAYATMFVSHNYRLVTKPFYASYGLILYGRGKGKYTYVPLIGDGAQVKNNGKTIESELVPISSDDIGQIDLIQSYSCNPVEDYRNGNFDTISKLYTDTISEGHPDFNVQLIMNIVSNDGDGVGLVFKVDQGVARMNAHDDFNNITLRKSLWPIIFDNKKDEL